MFRIRMLPAQRGDALAVEYGDPASPHIMMIDGGPSTDYRKGSAEEKAWNAQIDSLGQAGKKAELLVITHIDADHIEGSIELLNQVDPQWINEVWFNGWKHLQPEDRLGPVQGEILSTLLEQKELKWNERFGGEAVVVQAGKALPRIELEGGMVLTLLSPDLPALVRLRPKWEEEVTKAGLKPGVPVEKAKWPRDLLGGPPPLDVEEECQKSPEIDTSEANGSSIVFLAEYEGKSCLFGADARPPVLENGLKMLFQERGLVAGRDTLRLDALKVPHHGSKNNNSPALFEMLDSRRYLVSTNGAKFKHPDRQALAYILKRCSSQQGDPPTLYFNYHSDYTGLVDVDILKVNYCYQTLYGDYQNPGLVIDL